jgi:uncharacterized protein
MEIAIISDTHMPKGRRRLPPECVARLRAAGLVIHAGDLATLDVLAELQALNPRVLAVHGNVDEAAVRRVLPAAAQIDLEGHRLAVLHDAGPATGRLRRLRRRFPEANAVIFGHSHIPLHEVDPHGFQILNPGSPTERRRAPHHTMAVATIGLAGLGFEIVALD